jgi:hypothetical protein
MPKVKAKVTCFIDNSLRNEGDEFEYNGPENGNVEIIDGTDFQKTEVKVEDTQVAKQKWTPKNKTVASSAD